MTTHDNAVPQPDWLPDSPRCVSCRSRETYCRFIGEKLGASCCVDCSHGIIPLAMPAGWIGGEN